MMRSPTLPGARAARPSGYVLTCVAAFAFPAQAVEAQNASTATPAAARTAPTADASSSRRKGSPYHSVAETSNAKNYYRGAWGLDKLKVSYTSSGNLIRFSYRVLEPKLAKALGDKDATPQMYGQKSHALLQIPVMEKIGQLRQTGIPQAGQEYWMVFSNKGNLVRRGDRVDVIIGKFHADGLLVE